MQANNVTRLLEAKKIQFETFSLPEEKLGAIETAQLLGVPAEIVYKTIVTRREQSGKYVLAIIPGNTEVDLKLLAKVFREKKMVLVTQAEAEKATGMLAGGISPLACLNKGFQIVIDDSAIPLEYMHISGGQRGLNIRIHPADLIQLTHAFTAKVTHPVV